MFRSEKEENKLKEEIKILPYPKNKIKHANKVL